MLVWNMKCVKHAYWKKNVTYDFVRVQFDLHFFYNSQIDVLWYITHSLFAVAKLLFDCTVINNF